MRIKYILWIVFALVLGAGVFYWTTVKNRIVKKVITKTLRKKTDSLYKLSYDTAVLDEVGGNAYLYNVRITLDSARWLKLVQQDSMPPVTMTLTVEKLTIQGLKTLDLLNNHALDVKGIILERPLFRLEKWSRKQPPPEALNDTLEIYKRLTGQFDFIHAGVIQVKNADITVINNLKKDSVVVRSVDFSVDNVLVDSLHNYRDVYSYFVARSILSAAYFSNKDLFTGKILYDSKAHYIRIDGISSSPGAGSSFRTSSITVTGFSAEQFVAQGIIRAAKISIDKPDIVVVDNGKKNTSKPAVFPVTSIDSVLINNGKGEIRTKGAVTSSFSGVNIGLRNVRTVNGKFVLADYLTSATCYFAIGSLTNKMGMHRLQASGISYPGKGDMLSIQQISLKPAITREQLKTQIRKQADMYTINARKISIDRPNLKKILKDTISFGAVNLQIDLHVFDDKTLPVDSVKKGRGLFPYDKLRLSKTTIDIKTLYATNSSIEYEEQAPKSKLNGVVSFKNLTGKVTNITNMRSLIAKNNIMHIEARANIMGSTALVSDWKIPLDKEDGSLQVTGKLAPFHIPILNPAFEPLAMASIRSGEAERLEFEINGNHEGSTGSEVFKYRDLKVDLLRKNDQDSLEKKGFVSFLANADIRNNSQSDKFKEFKFKKDRYKSLFNLLWHSVFEGAKQTILIVK